METPKKGVRLRRARRLTPKERKLRRAEQMLRRAEIRARQAAVTCPGNLYQCSWSSRNLRGRMKDEEEPLYRRADIGILKQSEAG
jgi:hypothetical protein